jgi:hypothetical protein
LKAQRPLEFGLVLENYLKVVIILLFMSVSQYYLEHIKKEQEGFRRVLNRYFPNSQYVNPRILNICSGIANEEPLLIHRFGKKTELLSLDNDTSLEELLADLRRKSVVIGDLREIHKFTKGKYDIVMGRNIPLHPNSDSFREKIPDIWPGLFENLVKYFNSDSTLFLTLVREDEFYRAQEILDSVGYRIKVKEKNPIRVQSDYIGIRGADKKDDYVIIAQSPLQLRLF